MVSADVEEIGKDGRQGDRGRLGVWESPSSAGTYQDVSLTRLYKDERDRSRPHTFDRDCALHYGFYTLFRP